MKYFLVLTVAAAAFSLAARAETAAPAAEETTAPPADLTGYRLCPQCNTLNPPKADYCMRCGANVGEGKVEAKVTAPAAVRGFALTPFGFAGYHEALGGGVRGRFDRGAWSYAPSYAYDAYWPETSDNHDHQHHCLANDGRFYFGAAAARPFLGGTLTAAYNYYRFRSVYPTYYERESHYFFVFAGFGGGLEVNYDSRGSFLDVRGFAGPAAEWYGSFGRNPRILPHFSFSTGNVVYFSRHVGLDVHFVADSTAGYYSENHITLEIGPAFAW